MEGSTENAAVCTRLVADLADRGLDADRGVLLVIDGGKALHKAIRQVFAGLRADPALPPLQGAQRP